MVSKVFMVCDAYESGMGHGLKQDGLSTVRYDDPELSEAYSLGYEAGDERAKEIVPHWSVIADDVNTPKGLTDMKTQWVIKNNGYKVAGYVLTNGTDMAISYGAAIRWLTAEKLFNVMHDMIPLEQADVTKDATCFLCHGTGQHAIPVAIPAGVPVPPVQMTECLQCKVPSPDHSGIKLGDVRILRDTEPVPLIVSKESALEALDSIDDCARMELGVDAMGPRCVLEKYIAQQEARVGLLEAAIAAAVGWVEIKYRPLLNHSPSMVESLPTGQMVNIRLHAVNNLFKVLHADK